MKQDNHARWPKDRKWQELHLTRLQFANQPVQATFHYLFKTLLSLCIDEKKIMQNKFDSLGASS